MNIDVTASAPAVIEVTETTETVEVTQQVNTVDAVARTVQPEAAGMFVEYLGDDDWTIWIEDGK